MRLRRDDHTTLTTCRAMIVAALMAIPAAGCRGSDSVVPPAPVARIDVTLDSVPTVGHTRQATAVTTDANGVRVFAPTLTWSSADTTVASVSPTGAVSGTGIGTALISATAGAVTATLPVTITPSVTIVPSSAVGTLLGRSGAISDAGTFVVSIAGGTCTGGSPLPPSPALGSTSSPFTYTPIATNPCSGTYAIAAINTGGVLAGYRGGLIDSHAITWRAGVETQLGESPAGGAPSHAAALDDAGDVVGDVTVPFSGGTTTAATLWPRGGAPLLLQAPSGASSSATGIDAHGEIVGWTYTSADGGDRAQLWTVSDQPPVSIPTATGYGTADAISANGQFVIGHSENVGTHTAPGMCYLWSRASNTVADLGNFDGGRVEAVGVNDNGEVIANLRGNTTPEGVFRTRTGTLVSLGPVQLTGINNTGHVVGFANSSVYIFTVHAPTPAH